MLANRLRDQQLLLRTMIAIKHKQNTIAIIIPAEYEQDGIHFFTPNEYSQQLAYMKRPSGYMITPHMHKTVSREVFNTLETLIVRRGKVRVNFYDDQHAFIQDHILKTGDVILLVSGGHGFEMIEESEIIEIKQGPFMGDQDKIRF
jgi:hypothetical protein